MKRLAVATCLLGLLLPATAGAGVPAEMPLTAYLTDDQGVPLDSQVSVTVSIYPSKTGGTALYTETFQANPKAGAVTLTLGSTKELDLSLFENNETLYAGITVGNDSEMRPRLRLATTPYAALAKRAENAAKLGGKKPSTYAKPDWKDVKNKPGNVGKPYSAKGPISIDSKNRTIGISSCPNGQVLKWESGSWSCSPDASNTYGAGAGLALNNQTFRLKKQVCSGSKVATGISKSGALVCREQKTATYSAGTGLTLSGRKFSVDASTVQRRINGRCSSGQKVVAVRRDGTLKCGPDRSGSGDISAVRSGSGLTGGGDSGDVQLSIDANGVENKHLSRNSVDSDALESGSVGSSELSTNAVGSNHIGSGAVGTDEHSKKFACDSNTKYRAFKSKIVSDGTCFIENASSLPNCDEVPPGGMCEYDGVTCGGSDTDIGVNNCSAFDVYIRASW